jgi:hypothetical protein
MKILFLVVAFLVLGALFILSEKGILLKNNENITNFVNSYSGWVKTLGENSKNLVGYISKLEWLPKEEA